MNNDPEDRYGENAKDLIRFYRDLFAGLALLSFGRHIFDYPASSVAHKAYSIADAMIVTREKVKP